MLVVAECCAILVAGDRMKIALVQMNTTVGDVCGNRDGVLQAMTKAERMSADIAVFPGVLPDRLPAS